MRIREVPNQRKSHIRQCLLGTLIFAAGNLQAQVHPVEVPQRGQPLSSPRSAAVDAGDYVYLSGQGAQRRDHSMPDKFEEQASQALENIKTIVEAAGLNMEHIVYVQVYLEDLGNYEKLNDVFAKYFPGPPPARAVLGVYRLSPSSIEINAGAVRDLTGRKAVIPPHYKSGEPFSPGILTHDRLFVSAIEGRDPLANTVPDDAAVQTDLALDGLQAVVEAAGLKLSHMVFVNPYLTQKVPMRVMNERYARRFEFGNTPARATIEVTALPHKAPIEYTGVAVRDLALRKAVRPKNMPPSPTASPCVFAGDTLYCSAKDGFIPGPHGGLYATTTQHQLRQTMRNQLDNLEEADMKFDDVVSTVIYLDDLSDRQAFDQVYAEYFGSVKPAATTVQQIAPTERKADNEGHFPGLEQVSLIAVRKQKK